MTISQLFSPHRKLVSGTFSNLLKAPELMPSVVVRVVAVDNNNGY